MEATQTNYPNVPDFLSHAMQMGDEIIENAIKDSNGWYWEVRDHTEKIDAGVTFYNGSSGTIAFLLELYNVTKEQRYLDAAIAGVNWLTQYKYFTSQNNLAFYCGIGGVIYVLLETAKITGMQEYTDFALHLAKTYNGPNTNSDILYGSAGSVLTLLHLHNETNEDWIIEEIHKKTEQLLHDALFYKNGVCWERSGAEIHPLCGFAHGVSGISFVFLELYRYFKNEIFLKIAELGYDYEDQYFNNNDQDVFQNNNWPDLRKDVYTEDIFQKLINAYVINDRKEFTDFTFMSAWCHGAPGIGMSRLHAYNITRKELHRNYFNAALENLKGIINANGGELAGRNFTFCHGVLGNASLFLDAYVGFNDEQAYNIALAEGIRALTYKEQFSEFISGVSRTGGAACSDLMNGKAGIGHYYLRLAAPHTTSSFLVPCLKEIKNQPGLLKNYDENYLLELIYRKTFPNTSMLLIPDNLAVSENKQKLKDKIIGSTFKYLNDSSNENVTAALSLDLKINKIADNAESDNYFYVKDFVEKRKFNAGQFDKFNLSDLYKREITLNNAIALEKQNNKNYSSYYVLYASPVNEIVTQYTISEYLFDLLNSYKEKINIENAFRIIVKKYFTMNSSAINFTINYKAQLRVCLLNNLLFLDVPI